MRKLFSALACSLLLNACTSHPKPVPPPDPPREVHLTVVGDGQLVANKVSYATLTPEPTNVPLDVVPYNDTCFQLRDGVMVQDCPRLKAVLPADVPYGWGARLHIEVPGYQIYHERVELKVDIHVILTP